MAGFAKAILASIIVAIIVLMLTNFIFFFPWYLTLIYETFNLSQTAANDNYVKQVYYDATLDRLKDTPVFSDKANEIEIIAPVGNNNETIYEDYPDWEKPYKQRGQPINVEINAVYPFRITVAGKKIERDLPVSFSLTVTGLKYYKDLEYSSDF